MAEEAEKVRAAFAAIHEAWAASDGAFNDKAGDAINLRRSFRFAVEKAAKEGTSKEDVQSINKALEDEQKPDERIIVFKCLFKAAEKKPQRRNQVKEIFQALMQRDVWLYACDKDEETKAKLVEFMRQYSELNELTTKVEEGPPVVVGEAYKKKKEEERKRKEQDGDEPLESPRPDAEEAPEEITKRLLHIGLEGFRECNFVYPTGLHTEQASDDALEAFNRNFQVAIGRIDTRVKVLGSKEEDASEYEVIVKEIKAEELPLILNFMVSLWNARQPYRNLVVACVNKFATVSPRFKKVVDDRSGRTDRLPWLPALPALPEYPPIGTMALPDLKIAPHPPITVGEKATVVWIDSKTSAYTDCKALFDVGLNVQGFHDDWSKGPSQASAEAARYLVNALTDPKEQVVAIIVNNGPTHKQMLRDIRDWSFKNGRAAPLIMACTMKGQYADFVDCGLTFLSKDRRAVEAIAVEEAQIRKHGGHKFVKDQKVAVFSSSLSTSGISTFGWVKGSVLDIEEDGKVVVVYGSGRKSIPPHDFGLWLRCLPEKSIFHQIAVDPPSVTPLPTITPPSGVPHPKAGYPGR